MQLSGASAALATAFTLLAAVPALSEDFSITDQGHPVPGHPNLMRELQAWWEVHAAYPEDAAAADESGTLKLHVVVHPDGNVYPSDVVQGSGSCALDTAGSALFRGAFVHPFTASEPGQSVGVDLSLHYVLTHRHDQAMPAGYKPGASRAGFTITNDPPTTEVVDTVLQRICTGTVTKLGIRNHPEYGIRGDTTIVFYRNPDGTPMARIGEDGFGFYYSPVTVAGQMMQFMGGAYRHDHGDINWSRYTVWPDGQNHLIGDTAWPRGTVDLNCSSETVPRITSTKLTFKVNPKFLSGVAVPQATTCHK